MQTPNDQIYVLHGEPSNKKKQLILKWNEIEEIRCRMVLNLEIGVEVLTRDKRLKSYNLVT